MSEHRLVSRRVDRGNFRGRLVHGIATSVAVSLAVLGSIAHTSEALCAAIERKPNIVVILADDLGYGDLRCYNHASKIPTPRIDALAAQGLRFTDMHTPSSVCSPTRYGLLTGRYSWRGTLKKGVLNGYSPALVEPGRLTLASLCGAQGYRTACVGKWHLGLGNQTPADYSQDLVPGPQAVGFDESFVLPASLDMPPYVFVENQRATVFPSETIGDSAMRRYGGEGYWRKGAIAPGFRHRDTLPTLKDRALKFIRQQTADRPFLLYFPLTGPHTPWMPLSEFRGQSGAGYYGDFVCQVDDTVGQVLDALAEKQLDQNTIVVFTSDNGAHWLPKDIDEWQHRANAAWRGQKADLYEGGHRVPLIVRWPGKVAGGGSSSQLACTTDIVATCADILGQTLPDDSAEDSFSWLPVLLNQPRPSGLRRAVVHHSSDGTFAIRDGAWKLATKLGSHGFSEPREVEPEAGGPQGQLYNLEKDPGETNNLWLAEPAVVERLNALLAQYQREGRSRASVGPAQAQSR